ncbi:MAG: hypothetical protein QOE51_1046 [Actinoplanes sp.]|jgi:hypothetical protein|nr:hypothetical protein [Actinoplanes sp.]
MTRFIDELAASLFDVIPAQYVLLILLVLGGLTAALWYWYPSWVPRRLPHLRLPHWRLRLPHWRLRRPWRRPRRVKIKKEPAPAYAEKQPDRPATVPGIALSLADRLAADGRYAEAIRERLRETVGALTAAGVLDPEPGETAAELAWIASTRRPAVAVALGGATELFSEVWYGDRPAGRDQDERMRSMSGEVQARLHDGGKS